MRKRLTIIGPAALVCAGIALAAGCSDQTTGIEPAATQSTPAVEPAAHSASLNKTLAQLRRATAKFHTLAGAAAAGYITSIGCVDETIDGVDPAQARGMGYHLGQGPDGLGLVDDVTDLFAPEFLVYAPAENDAELPPEERLAHARLVALDYFRPGTPDNPPPPLLGQEWTFSPPFGGWIRHIYLWGDNPDGLFSDWDPAVPLCS